MKIEIAEGLAAMGTYNYRVIKSTYVRTSDSEDCYQIHDVYYDETGLERGWAQEPASPYGETIIELKETLGRMLRALEKPVLVVSGNTLIEEATGNRARGVAEAEMTAEQRAERLAVANLVRDQIERQKK